MVPTIDSTAAAVFTDLDGTLLDANQQLAPVNRGALEQLGKDEIWRIVVTGRSLFSARRVLDPHFPIDVLVTSSGAGIFRFPAEQVLHSAMMEERHVQGSASLLKRLALDFMVHAPLPDGFSTRTSLLISWSRHQAQEFSASRASRYCTAP